MDRAIELLSIFVELARPYRKWLSTTYHEKEEIGSLISEAQELIKERMKYPLPAIKEVHVKGIEIEFEHPYYGREIVLAAKLTVKPLEDFDGKHD